MELTCLSEEVQHGVTCRAEELEVGAAVVAPVPVEMMKLQNVWKTGPATCFALADFLEEIGLGLANVDPLPRLSVQLFAFRIERAPPARD